MSNEPQAEAAYQPLGDLPGDGLEQLNSNTLLKDANDVVRLGFIRKVYGLLTVQLALTAAIAYPIMIQPKHWAADHWWVAVVSMIAALAIICYAGKDPSIFRTFPTNYVLLFVYTAFEAVLVGIICSAYTMDSVILIFGITCLMFACLTAYAMMTSHDFTTTPTAYIMGALFGLIFIGLFSWFIPGLDTVYSALAALLFGMFIVYDTQMIMGGGHKRQFGIDDYVWAAIAIYLDIINLFINLLELYGRRR